MPDRPNLVFVLADQMRAKDMGCSGNPQVKTPNLDRMAESGVRFVNGTTNMPVCTPARASLLTGRYAQSTGVFLNDIQMSIDEITIAHVLRDEGYDTGYVGKWHLDGPGRYTFTPPGPRRFGFDFWHAINCDHRDYLSPYYYEDTDSLIMTDEYCVDYETDVALRWIESRENPFCLFLSWSPPHNPYDQLPDRWIDSYDPDEIELPENTPDTPDNRRDLAGYYAHISAIDDNIGRIPDSLEAQGLSDDTIVVFTSDHGDMLGAHGRYRKQWPWDESVLVPLIVSHPGALESGDVSGVLVNIPDLMPTLLSWMDIECPRSVEGADLSGVIAGNQSGPSSAFISIMVPFAEQVEKPWRMVRTEQYTYARDPGGPWLLFDNISDPDQLNNLIGNPEMAEIERGLDRELDDWLERLDDGFLPPEEHLDQYGYEVDEQHRMAPYTYALSEPDGGWPKHQIAKSRLLA
ncbi:MAG: sulfatase [Candidatus Latescibacteria bacterium]|nr:sulfatase [Candidatus Latescibacterota bacterium]